MNFSFPDKFMSLKRILTNNSIKQDYLQTNSGKVSSLQKTKANCTNTVFKMEKRKNQFI